MRSSDALTKQDMADAPSSVLIESCKSLLDVHFAMWGQARKAREFWLLLEMNGRSTVEWKDTVGASWLMPWCALFEGHLRAKRAQMNNWF